MASIITGDSVGLGLSCSATRKLYQTRNHSSSRLSFCSIKMVVSVEEEKKKKSFILKKSEEAFNAAKEMMPGGVNSPVRAFKSVGGQPIVFDSVKGSHMKDIDGNDYIDHVGSWGPAVIGHADDEVLAALAETMKKGTSFGAPCLLENVLAEMVIKAVSKHRYGSWCCNPRAPDSPGVPRAATYETLTAPYNDIAPMENLFEINEGEICAVILEPVVGNAGFIPPKPEFLNALSKIIKEINVLIFDEVMTGFRLSYGGGHEYFCITPDLPTLGKIIGGGLPVGASGGRREIMEMVVPAGPMYQAATLSGDPLAMTAGIHALKRLQEPGSYEYLDKITSELVQGIIDAGKKTGHAICGGYIRGMFGFFFTEGPVYNFADAKKSDKPGTY
ncbi:hypothetical protein NC653_029650 [Populus alba x Populus x berolinensis]|uniref:Glutamate-1-semialdehyde 2,1-aminomutase n=1 Tax=Populus alba x Populus x berolinensis TaxID=444605 RepID=A0AAD6M2X1_9ROSI|nr:hypothetical protein NC653_029650 [Populus alba x Populus x berolinensis]